MKEVVREVDQQVEKVGKEGSGEDVQGGGSGGEKGSRERVVQGMAIHNPIQHPDRSRSQIHFRTEGWVTSCDTPNRTSIGSELTPQEDNALERRAVPANNSINNFPWQALIGRRACIIVALGQGKPRTNKEDCRLQTEGAEGEMQGACGATLRTGTGRIRPRPRESLTIDALTAAQGAAAPMARDGAGCPEVLWPNSLRALRDDSCLTTAARERRRDDGAIRPCSSASSPNAWSSTSSRPQLWFSIAWHGMAWHSMVLI